MNQVAQKAILAPGTSIFKCPVAARGTFLQKVIDKVFIIVYEIHNYAFRSFLNQCVYGTSLDLSFSATLNIFLMSFLSLAQIKENSMGKQQVRGEATTLLNSIVARVLELRYTIFLTMYNTLAGFCHYRLPMIFKSQLIVTRTQRYLTLSHILILTPFNTRGGVSGLLRRVENIIS